MYFLQLDLALIEYNVINKELDVRKQLKMYKVQILG